MKSHEKLLQKAQTTLSSAGDFLVEPGSALDTAIESAYTAATCALKAFLAYHSEFCDATDLDELLETCLETDPSAANLSAPVEDLIQYYIIFRNSAEIITPENDEAAESIRLAGEILEWVAGKINSIENGNKSRA